MKVRKESRWPAMNELSKAWKEYYAKMVKVMQKDIEGEMSKVVEKK
jgi:hypothetical protein